MQAILPSSINPMEEIMIDLRNFKEESLGPVTLPLGEEFVLISESSDGGEKGRILLFSVTRDRTYSEKFRAEVRYSDPTCRGNLSLVVMPGEWFAILENAEVGYAVWYGQILNNEAGLQIELQRARVWQRANLKQLYSK